MADAPAAEAPIGPQLPDTRSDTDGSGTHTWYLRDFSKVKDRRHHSEPFKIGEHGWRLLVFTRGNQCEYLSLYLDVADLDILPHGWSRHASFTLTVVSQTDPSLSVRKEATHNFCAREQDWGFTQFVPLQDLHDVSKGFLLNDTLVVECEVVVKKEGTLYAYDSRKETGHIGLKNQGATCYMNSLLQTLFHIPYFRKAVYHLPTTENDTPSKSIPLALQALFYKLQFSETSVATKDLTRSFGWDATDAFMQHDVQELNRVLCDKLDEKMKATSVEGTIQKLFEGHMQMYVECINVDYKSSRKESFLDLQLDVKGCKNVYESFDRYVEVEKLEGDNKYRAEQHGLQDARKGILFTDLPSVLQLHLRRFDYDFQRDVNVKINQRYEFPEVLDLDVEDGKYLAEDADRTVRNRYLLHSVLVHSGGVHGGHYYAFIRPDPTTEEWLKFDDERVTREEKSKAIDEQFGGEDDGTNPPGKDFKFTKYSNAYMLVYVRESDMGTVRCEVTQDDIAPHLRERLRQEQEEKDRKRKEKQEAHLYTIVKVARDDDLKDQIGSELHFDLVEHEKCRHFRVQKQKPWGEFKEMIAQELGVPVEAQRYWVWAKRQNGTYRPSRVLLPAEEVMTVAQVREATNAKNSTNMDLKVLLETPFPPGPERTLPVVPKGDILLFVKVYDPTTETLRYGGRLFASGNSRISDHRDAICAFAGLPRGSEVLYFEEIKFDPQIMCEAIDRRMTLSASQLEDGDIVCVQLNLPPAETSSLRFPTVPEFLEHVRNRQMVSFRELEKPKDDKFTLELSKTNTYDEVCERLAKELGLADPTLIRLTSHNCYSHQPKPQPLKFRSVDHLSDMLVHYNNTSEILYYEVLDLPLPELERLKTLKVVYHGMNTQEVSVHQIRLPKESCVTDVLHELNRKLTEARTPPTGELRMLEVFYHKIYKVFALTDKIDSINDQYWTIRAEQIPEEEKEVLSNERIIHVYHFSRDTTSGNVTVHNHSEPFLLKVRDDETLAEVKNRIQCKLGVADEDFSTWKVSFYANNLPHPMEDTEVVAARFAQKRDHIAAWDNYLGLEHAAPKNANKRPHSQQQTRGYEKPIRIFN